MKKQTWKFELNGINYTAEASAREITVTPGETLKFKNLKKSGNMMDQQFEIPVEGSSIYMHVDVMGKRKLVVNGIDVETGAQYQEIKLPKWGWVFVVLYVIDFFLFLGGALGAVVNLLLLSLVAKVASDNNKKTLNRVLTCTGVYIVSTVLELIFAILIGAALYA